MEPRTQGPKDQRNTTSGRKLIAQGLDFVVFKALRLPRGYYADLFLVLTYVLNVLFRIYASPYSELASSRASLSIEWAEREEESLV